MIVLFKIFSMFFQSISQISAEPKYQLVSSPDGFFHSQVQRFNEHVIYTCFPKKPFYSIKTIQACIIKEKVYKQFKTSPLRLV